MSPRIVRRRVEAAYQLQRRHGGVVDLSRSSPLSDEELALFADLDRYDEMIEMSELAAYARATRGRYEGYVFRGTRAP